VHQNAAKDRMQFLLVVLLAASQGAPLTLAEALAEARAANARLPVAAMDVKVTEGQVRSARGQLRPRIGLQSDLQVAPRNFGYSSSGTAVGEERLQLTASEGLYAGGARHAAIAGAEAGVRASKAAYRVAEKDLDLELRTRFSEVLKGEDDVRFRAEGLARLRSYLLTIRQRQAAGEGLQRDVLKTEARLASEEADAEEAARQLRTSEMELADLLGRDPETPVAVVPLPLPEPTPAFEEAAWQQVPDLLQGAAQIAAADSRTEIALAGRRPRVDLTADAGLFGPGFVVGLPPGGLSQRLRDDLGASLTLSFSWSLLDFGIYQGEIGQARALAEQARRQVVVVARQARFRLDQAREDTVRWYREVELRKKALPLARDAYLSAESGYRGGSGTALDVLDSFATLISASQAYADAIYFYRVAQATAIRWGTP
jgi:outer membrane protein TolC